MPYISDGRRDKLYPIVHNVRHPGELNYQITCLVHQYLRENGFDYKTLNEVVGVLECAKLELYRHVVGPYEDKKIAENGDLTP